MSWSKTENVYSNYRVVSEDLCKSTVRSEFTSALTKKVEYSVTPDQRSINLFFWFGRRWLSTSDASLTYTVYVRTMTLQKVKHTHITVDVDHNALYFRAFECQNNLGAVNCAVIWERNEPAKRGITSFLFIPKIPNVNESLAAYHVYIMLLYCS
jgi:hypothetical protein